MQKEIINVYYNLRKNGMSEVDIEKVTGVPRQYFHKYRKQNGSTDMELALASQESVFSEL